MAWVRLKGWRAYQLVVFGEGDEDAGVSLHLVVENKHLGDGKWVRVCCPNKVEVVYE